MKHLGNTHTPTLAPAAVVHHHADRLMRSLPQLQDVVRMAAEVAGTAASAVNLVHADGQEALVTWGVPPAMCSIEDSMCRRSVTERGPVHVHDAREDPQFVGNRWVTGALGTVRFYGAHPLAAPDGTLIGTLCVWDSEVRPVDATVRRRLAALAGHVEGLLRVEQGREALTRAVDELSTHHLELRRSNEALSGFAAHAAHDLRTPLSSSTMMLDLLGGRPALRDDPEASVLLDRLRGAHRRMDRLVTGFLELASLDAQSVWEPVDLGEVLLEVVQDLGAAASRHRLRLGSMPVVRGDAVQLRVLLQNLVANAVRHGATTRDRTVRVCGGGVAECWWLEVADNGPGVPEALRESVFAPLVRGPGSREGLGLGLAACRRIAGHHNADIEVLDAPEGGALFRVVAFPGVSAGAAAPGSAPRG